jgi:hypothetical protein
MMNGHAQKKRLCGGFTAFGTTAPAAGTAASTPLALKRPWPTTHQPLPGLTNLLPRWYRKTLLPERSVLW